MDPGRWARWADRGAETGLSTYITTTILLILTFAAVSLVTRCPAPILAGRTLTVIVVVRVSSGVVIIVVWVATGVVIIVVRVSPGVVIIVVWVATGVVVIVVRVSPGVVIIVVGVGTMGSMLIRATTADTSGNSSN